MQAFIGVDLGGTKIEVARVEQGIICTRRHEKFDAQGSEASVVWAIIELIESCMTEAVVAIGVGVPGVVDTENGIVYDLVNIPSWRKVYLKKALSDYFGVAVVINNDANCFAIGEKRFGRGKPYKDIVGISLGTGLGVGLVVNNNLHSGINCGAGEFGQIQYLDSDYESYCSGRFFKLNYSVSGEELCRQAKANNPDAIAAFKEFGVHLGRAIASMLLAYDPQCIVIGGSVAKAYPYFKDEIFSELEKFPYQSVIKTLKIEQSVTRDIAVLGAASLVMTGEYSLCSA